MMAKITTVMLLGVSVTAGCGGVPGTATEGVATAQVTADDIKEIPAVTPQRYPNSIGYLYQGSLAKVFWLQNDPGAATLDDLTRRMGRLAERGIAGEIVSSSMQQVDTVSDTQPTLPDLASRTAQSVYAMNQYAFLTSDYASSLGAALSAYNADPVRKQTLTDSAAHVEAELESLATATGGSVVQSPPSVTNSESLIRPGKYFADAVKDHARALLDRNVARLQRAIDARDANAYATAFIEVFLMQRDIALSPVALEGLAVHHQKAVLRGQALDAVIANYASRSPDEDHPYSVDQLCLINQINLISNTAGSSRRALVAALLLIDEDHRQLEQDTTLSPPLIWQHISDADWLVSQYVRLKADGITLDQANAQVDSIVASI
jgi:hypothetical protein